MAAIWRHISHSVRGAAHLDENSSCQDHNCVRILSVESADSLIACVADGAGSAKHSAIGSEIACDAVKELATVYFEQHGCVDDVDDKVALHWCKEARTRIRDEANLREVPPRQFATTLCVAVVGTARSSFFQIGDGAIILGSGGVYGVVFWPQSGEYANTTNFLTSDDYADHVEFRSTDTRFSDLALLTDGLERLALRFDNQTPHAPFFSTAFRRIALR